MTQTLTPAEKIEAAFALAIDKLEGLKRYSTRGEWLAAVSLGSDNDLQYSVVSNDSEGSFDVVEAVTDESISRPEASANADLIEALHRTIDAQLAILRSGQNIVLASGREPVGISAWGWDGPRVAEAFALAAAVLGAKQ